MSIQGVSWQAHNLVVVTNVTSWRYIHYIGDTTIGVQNNIQGAYGYLHKGI